MSNPYYITSQRIISEILVDRNDITWKQNLLFALQNDLLLFKIVLDNQYSGKEP